MKTLLLRILPLLALAIAPLLAQDNPLLPALKAADDERIAAVIAADRARLTAILSEQLHYAHSTGGVDTRDSLIAALTSGRSKYLALDYEKRNFTFPAPGIALMDGRVHVKVSSAAGTTDGILSFLGVWRDEGGKWRFLAWQSCKVPPPAPAAK